MLSSFSFYFLKKKTKMPQILPKSGSSPAPASIYNYTTTEELIAMFPIPKEGKSSKCVVYTLATFVTLFTAGLLFASIVFRVRDPKIELVSAWLNHTPSSYKIKPSSSFNMTVIVGVIIMNPNFGCFDYGNGRVSVLYGVSSVGAWELEGAKVDARGTKKFNLKVNLRFKVNEPLVSGNLTNDIHSGKMKLRSYAKLSGTVHVLKFVKKRITIVMACIMNFNLTSYSALEHFQR